MNSSVRTTTSILFCLAALWITPVYAGLIGVSSTGNVYGVDTSTGAGTLIGSSGLTNLQNLTRDPFGTMFTVDNLGGGIFKLDTINPITGAGTVGPTVTGLGSTLSVSGLAFSAADILFASADLPSFTATDLYTINTTTGAATLVGTISTGANTDIAFAPTGTLYGWNLSSNTGLMTIDTSTGLGTVVQAVTTPLGIVGLAFDAGGNFFGVQTNGTTSNLYSIDASTGDTTLIGTVGAFALPGIAFAPVPEPGTLLSTLGGLIALSAIGIVRRDRARSH